MLLKKTDFNRILEKESGESERMRAVPQPRATGVCMLGGANSSEVPAHAVFTGQWKRCTLG